jgi:inward rectifier potassium channel
MSKPEVIGKNTPRTIPRMVRRGGTVNVQREGFRRMFLSDYFHSLLQRSWPRLLFTVLVFVLISNAIFATLYELLNLEITNAETWWDHFFFSVQTMATVGYGHMAPVGVMANFVAALESIYGLMVFGVIAGLVFAKFSRPTSKLIFSDVAVIAKRNGRDCLMFRMVNERESQIIDGKLNVTLMRNEITTEGHKIRTFVDMSMVRAHTPIFALTFTAIHVIDEKSPLLGETIETLRDKSIEVVVLFSGVDEIFSQNIYARHSYVVDEMRWNHRFHDILGELPDGRRVINFRKFHLTDELGRPESGGHA